MSVGAFTVLAGPFKLTPNACQVRGTTLYMAKPPAPPRSFRIQWSVTEKISVTQIASLGAIGHDFGKSFGTAVAAGIAGGLLLGGVGALAGVLAAGDHHGVTFQVTLRDGRSFMGSATPQVFQMLQAAAFSSGLR